MNRFLNPFYFIEVRPDPNFQYTKLTLTIGLLLIIIGIAIFIIRKQYLKDPIIKKIIRHYHETIFGFGAFTLILLLFREAGIPILSMRIWWLVLFGTFIYWIIANSINFKKEYQERKLKSDKHHQFKKYLPNKKR